MAASCGACARRLGLAYQSVLEQSESLDPPRFHEIAHGSGVEGKLRELLVLGNRSAWWKGSANQALKLSRDRASLSAGRSAEHLRRPASRRTRTIPGRHWSRTRLVPWRKNRSWLALWSGWANGSRRSLLRERNSRSRPIRHSSGFRSSSKPKKSGCENLRDADVRGKVIEERVVTLQAERLQLLEQTQAAEAAWSAAKEREARAIGTSQPAAGA